MHEYDPVCYCVDCCYIRSQEKADKEPEEQNMEQQFDYPELQIVPVERNPNDK